MAKHDWEKETEHPRRKRRGRGKHIGEFCEEENRVSFKHREVISSVFLYASNVEGTC